MKQLIRSRVCQSGGGRYPLLSGGGSAHHRADCFEGNHDDQHQMAVPGRHTIRSEIVEPFVFRMSAFIAVPSRRYSPCAGVLGVRQSAFGITSLSVESGAAAEDRPCRQIARRISAGSLIDSTGFRRAWAVRPHRRSVPGAENTLFFRSTNESTPSIKLPGSFSYAAARLEVQRVAA